MNREGARVAKADANDSSPRLTSTDSTPRDAGAESKQ
jgi:hypothetical protein